MKNFIILLIFIGSLQAKLCAQELSTVNYKTSDVYTSGISFSDNWKTDIELNNVNVYSGQIQNISSKNYKNLILNLYLLPVGHNFNDNSFQGYLLTETNFKRLDRNSKLIAVNILSQINQTPPDGLYNPVLVMTNQSGKVMAFKVLPTKVTTHDGVTFIGDSKISKPQIAENETPVQEIKNETEVIKKDIPQQKIIKQDPDSVVKIKTAIDNSVSLDKEWEVGIDFKEAVVTINGGNISNKNNFKVNDLTLNVYLTKDNITQINQDFEGVQIASANIGDIESLKTFVGTSVTAGLINIPQNGTYYILLTLSTDNGEGEQVIKSGKNFAKAVSF